MQTISNDVAGIVAGQRDHIRHAWIRAVVDASRGKTTTAEMERELLPIFDALLSGLRDGVLDPKHPAYDQLRAMLAEFSRGRARAGFSPSETAVAVFALRDAVLSQLQSSDAGTSIDILAFSKFIDGLGLLTFETYAEARERVITTQAEQLLELSTPVVKVWDGIVAVPLVGTLDWARTQVVMEALLQALVETGSSHAIIDITGVPAVDTQVAQHLMKTIMAARLMGADCIISGIRPQIAQTIVGLGVEFGEIATKATLADALRTTFQRAGLEVRSEQKV